MIRNTVLLILLLFQLLSKVSASVYPDKKEKALDFIKITREKNTYRFELCLISDKLNCEQIGRKERYSAQELRERHQNLRDRMTLNNWAVFLTVGMSLLRTADLYMVKETINPKNLNRDIHLKFKINKEGVATGSIYDYLSDLERALQIF